MRLWSLHPKYLDARGLVALWREGLLAQKVLLGQTKGYKNHPQLLRFSSHVQPVEAISNYLHEVVDEADRRGYQFDRTKLMKRVEVEKITLHLGQLEYEWQHLINKLEKRDSRLFEELTKLKKSEPHSLFDLLPGPIEPWEKNTL